MLIINGNYLLATGPDKGVGEFLRKFANLVFVGTRANHKEATVSVYGGIAVANFDKHFVYYVVRPDIIFLASETPDKRFENQIVILNPNIFTYYWHRLNQKKVKYYIDKLSETHPVDAFFCNPIFSDQKKTMLNLKNMFYFWPSKGVGIPDDLEYIIDRNKQKKFLYY